MPSAKKPKSKATSRRSFAGSVMKGVAEINSMLADGAKPEDRFVVRTIRPVDVRPPRTYSPEAVKRLRNELDVSQSVFAELLGVSRVWVQGWERGVRQPTALARRLLDTIATDPAGWVRRYADAS